MPIIIGKLEGSGRFLFVIPYNFQWVMDSDLFYEVPNSSYHESRINGTTPNTINKVLCK